MQLDLSLMKKTIEDNLNHWHKSNLTIFDLDPLVADEYVVLGVINAYNHYEMWHLLENYTYNVGKANNMSRNDTINKMNNIFVKYQKPNFDYINTEGIGNIIDKANICYIKYLHTIDHVPEKTDLIKQEYDFLWNNIQDLFRDMLAGVRGFKTFDIFKINYTYEDVAQK
jgi:hypothetical protein